MQVWVDADACPKIIKEILFKAANRTQILFIFVANHLLPIPLSPYLKKVQVQSGFDVADNYIIQHAEPGDLIITADIPLANAVVEKNATALNPRGELYTIHNIKHQLAIRDLNTELRSSGLISGGKSTLNKKEIQKFANALDNFLSH